MSAEQINSSSIPAANGPFSQAVAVPASSRLVFISGMTARTASGDIAGIADVTEQTHQICRNLRGAVEAAGGVLADIVRIDIYVTDIADAAAIQDVRREYFTGVAPAATMVEVSKLPRPEYLIEVNAIAAIG